MGAIAGGRMGMHRETVSGTARTVTISEGGIALITVLAIMLVSSMLAILVMTLTGREILLSRRQYQSTEAFYVAEGGAAVARRAAIALVQNLATNASAVAGGPANLTRALATMYAAGEASLQNPIGVLDFAGFPDALGGCCKTIPARASQYTPSFTYIVTTPSPSYPTMWVAADTRKDAFVALGGGAYVARIAIFRRLVTSARYPAGAYIEQSGPEASPAYTFHFTYVIESYGIFQAARRGVQLHRDFDAVISPQSFAHFVYFNGGMFGTAPPVGTCDVGRLFWGSSTTLDGPVHTNERFWLAGQPKFLSTIESANYLFLPHDGSCVPARQISQGLVHFFGNGTPQDVDGWCSPDPSCALDNPYYALGPASFNRLAPLIPMPANLYSQQRAALGGNPLDTSPVTLEEINQRLGLCEPTCPSSPPSTGVYLPSIPGGTSDPRPALTGGIYVQDIRPVGLRFSIDSGDNQVVQVTQLGNFVTTIVIDEIRAQTLVVGQMVSGTTYTMSYRGIPNGVMYIAGSVGALGGRPLGLSWLRCPTGCTCPADSLDAGYGALGSCIQRDSQITVAAQGDLTIDNHIRYEVDPRGPDGRWGTADDRLDARNILGLCTATGNINIADPAPDNLVIDAFLMAAQGQVQVIDASRRPPQGTVSVLGGEIVQWEGVMGEQDLRGVTTRGYGPVLSFDRRTLAAAALPPFFPSTQGYTAIFPNLTARPMWQELY